MVACLQVSHISEIGWTKSPSKATRIRIGVEAEVGVSAGNGIVKGQEGETHGWKPVCLTNVLQCSHAHKPQAKRGRGEEGAKLSSCLMPKLMHDVAALARLSNPLCVCVWVSVCSTCCCAHFNYEPDYNVSRPVRGGGSEGEAGNSSSSVGVSLHMRASIKSVNHAAIWQKEGDREGEWKWEKRERKKGAERERVGAD